MKQNNEIKEMIISSAVMFMMVFLPVFFLVNFFAALTLALCYMLLFYVPFLPLAYSFRELNFIERGFISNIMGIGYVGIYATLDVFFKIKLEMVTYSMVTIIIFCVSVYLYIKRNKLQN